MNDTTFERTATEALAQKDFKAFQETFLSHFAALADRAGEYIGRMCNRDREIVLQNALTLAWTLRDEFNPSTMSLTKYWDECLQGAVRMQKYWYVRAFDGWQRANSERLCERYSLPAFFPEDL